MQKQHNIMKESKFNLEKNENMNSGNLEIILQEFSIFGEESIFDNKQTWEYSLYCQSEKALVYIIPLTLFRNISPKNLEKMKDIYKQKLDFRSNLVKNKELIAKANLFRVPDDINRSHTTSNGINGHRFNNIVKDKVFFETKTRMMKQICQFRHQNKKSDFCKENYEQLAAFGKVEFDLRKNSMVKTSEDNLEIFHSKRYPSLKDTNTIRLGLTTKLINASKNRRLRVDLMKKSVI